ncbi:MAG: T9SS type A sorting domain-containing protein [Saprospiraceae bacterium]|nr:T9SS type A sorting domain-containing protein [Saprospiraceae bacterium]
MFTLSRLTITLSCIFALTIFSQINAQSCDHRYLNHTFSSTQVYRDVMYSRDAKKLIASVGGVETNINRDLVMDIYMPPPTDKVDNRPVLILAHGGGFVDIAFMGWTPIVGTMDNEDVQALAEDFARRGFVTASIEYRTGFDPLSEKSMKRAVWRGSQDVSAAVRFFRANQDWFDIDVDRVFVGGSSAGAFACLHAAFVDDNERIPESYKQTGWFGITLAPDLGEMHSRPVERLTGFHPFSSYSTPAQNVDAVADGVVSYWGAIGDPSWIAGNNSAPTIMFHGTSDWIVPPTQGRPFAGIIPGAPVTYGTQEIYPQLVANNIKHEVQLEPGQPHEYWGVLNGNWYFTGPNSYWQPMLQQTAEFFYSVMQDEAPSVVGPASATQHTVTTYSIANPDPDAEYCWNVDGGTIVSPASNGTSVDIYWWNTQTVGSIAVRSIDDAKVASEWENVNVSLNATPSLRPDEATTLGQAVNINGLTMYPNPSQGNLNIVFESTLNEVVNVEVMDVLGRSVYTNTWEVTEGVNTQATDLSHLQAGAYMVRIVSENTQATQQLIIQ